MWFLMETFMLTIYFIMAVGLPLAAICGAFD